MDKKLLQKTALEVRKSIVTEVHAAKSGHPGGSLSIADTLTYLYFYKMNVDPKILKWITETDLFSPKVTQLQHFMQFWQKKVSLTKLNLLNSEKQAKCFRVIQI